MTALQIYALFPGTAREALTFYVGVFGGTLASTPMRNLDALTDRQTQSHTASSTDQ